MAAAPALAQQSTNRAEPAAAKTATAAAKTAHSKVAGRNAGTDIRHAWRRCRRPSALPSSPIWPGSAISKA